MFLAVKTQNNIQKFSNVYVVTLGNNDIERFHVNGVYQTEKICKQS